MGGRGRWRGYGRGWRAHAARAAADAGAAAGVTAEHAPDLGAEPGRLPPQLERSAGRAGAAAPPDLASLAADAQAAAAAPPHDLPRGPSADLLVQPRRLPPCLAKGPCCSLLVELEQLVHARAGSVAVYIDEAHQRAWLCTAVMLRRALSDMLRGWLVRSETFSLL